MDIQFLTDSVTGLIQNHQSKIRVAVIFGIALWMILLAYFEEL